ncbi:DUF2802 domain-containing protein [Aliikangiella sp. G2MR2-5]|uniref:DUF2802 domain-containing protein n=1 Tax=Aliikangiella sp. G2MR2-5 TaxID=2788943 RepID=UPI0018ABD06F|nr:DUF2802 domain-containing protein [Aliikangiella sp. G2MR2-5]
MGDWPIQVSDNVFWLSLISSFATLLALLVCRQLSVKNRLLSAEVARLKNEFLAMNSGNLGMGRKIRALVREIEQVEAVRCEPSEQANDRAYEQAGLLLTRGATIEEVVDACGITPAEAELLAIMRHSAPSYGQMDKQSQSPRPARNSVNHKAA